jgi:transposase
MCGSPMLRRSRGLAPLACKTDKIDARVLAVLSQRHLVSEIWLPDPLIRSEREHARFRLHLVKHKSMLKHRIHSTLMSFGHPCPVFRSVRSRRPRAAGELPAARTPGARRSTPAST